VKHRNNDRSRRLFLDAERSPLPDSFHGSIINAKHNVGPRNDRILTQIFESFWNEIEALCNVGFYSFGTPASHLQRMSAIRPSYPGSTALAHPSSTLITQPFKATKILSTNEKGITISASAKANNLA
jgi:hypothetical protein